MTFAQSLILAMAASGAQSQNEVVWHWDRDTEACSLKQDTDAGETIEVGRTPGSGSAEVSITTKLSSNFDSKRFDDGFIELSPGGKFAADVSQYVHDGKLETGASTKDQTFMLKLATAGAIVVGHENGATSAVPLRSAAAAVDAIHHCVDQKMRAWGMDPVAWRALKSTPDPITPLWKRMGGDDYPLDAGSFSVTGDVVTRLDVGADGRVKQCRSLNASEYKGFEYATCNELKGARFHPALDSGGHPVAAPYVVLVHFRMQG